MARSVSGGAPPPSRALRVSFGNGLRPPLTAEPLHPLRSATKGQAEACPDRTQAIPCKVQHSSSRGAMPCPLRARSDSDPGYLTVTEGQPAARIDLRLSSLRQRRLRPARPPSL